VPANKTAVDGTRAGWGRAILPLLVVAVIAGAWLWGKRGSEPAAAGSSVKSTLHLETFVLNLVDPGERSYLRVGIDLGLGRELGKGKNDDAPPVAELRDTILSVLGQCKADDLVTEAGKDKLKADLLRALQARVPGQKVEEVYFTEFLIQR
jgi:flagellar basal body-associated protein FliL